MPSMPPFLRPPGLSAVRDLQSLLQDLQNLALRWGI